MKTKKLLFLSLFLIIGLLLFIPNAVNAATTIDAVTIDFKEAVPVVGEAPENIATIHSSEKYVIVQPEWYEIENGKLTDKKVGTFEYGKMYYFHMYLQPKEGYQFIDYNINPKVTTENITWVPTGITIKSGDVVLDSTSPYYGYYEYENFYAIGVLHEDVEIEETADIVPVVGGTPQYLNIFPDEYEEVSQEWYDMEGNPVTTFEEGKQYVYELTINHKTAFGWDKTSTFNVNNINWTDTKYESNIITGQFSFWRNYKSS